MSSRRARPPVRAPEAEPVSLLTARPVETASPQDILAAVHSVLRGEGLIELPGRGIDISFDGAVMAACRQCRVTWVVPQRNFRMVGWWSCPSGCRLPPRD